MPTIDDVLKVLEESKFTYRTIEGICEALETTPDVIVDIIVKNPLSITQSKELSKTGKPLFASARKIKDKMINKPPISIDEFTRFVKW
jgi:hypothetical protein